MGSFFWETITSFDENFADHLHSQTALLHTIQKVLYERGWGTLKDWETLLYTLSSEMHLLAYSAGCWSIVSVSKKAYDRKSWIIHKAYTNPNTIPVLEHVV